MAKFSVGDRVSYGGYRGTVVDIRPGFEYSLVVKFDGEGNFVVFRDDCSTYYSIDRLRKLVRKKRTGKAKSLDKPSQMIGILPTKMDSQIAEFLFDLQRRVNWLLENHK